MKAILPTLGALGIIASVCIVADFGPIANKIAGVIATSAANIAVMLARHNKVSSEQAGAGIVR